MDTRHLTLREHRQLLAAAKGLLNRLEQRGRNTFAPLQQADWVVIVQAQRAIEESRACLEIAGNARRPVHALKLVPMIKK